MGGVQSPNAKETFLKEIRENGATPVNPHDGHPVWERVTADQLATIREAEKAFTAVNGGEQTAAAENLWNALSPIHQAYEIDFMCRPEYQQQVDAANPVYKFGVSLMNVKSKNSFKALRAYTRWGSFNVLENAPTIFYDKFFTKSYLPFRTRNAKLTSFSPTL